MRERKSAPPLKKPDFSGIKAREMPDFSRGAFKPIKDSGELTIPHEFNLASLSRHERARRELEQRLTAQANEERLRREFKSKAMPDYESQQLCIMPSDRLCTVAVKPAFASDSLPKREVKAPSPKNTTEPKDFVF